MSTINKAIIDAGMRKASVGYIRRPLKTSELEYKMWIPEGIGDVFRVGIRENVGKRDFAIVFEYVGNLDDLDSSVHEIRTAVANNESW